MLWVMDMEEPVSSICTRPKSVILTVRSLSSSRFLGLMSRWVSPSWYTAWRPATTCKAISAVSLELNTPSSSSRAWMEAPSTYSMTR